MEPPLPKPSGMARASIYVRIAVQLSFKSFKNQTSGAPPISHATELVEDCKVMLLKHHSANKLTLVNNQAVNTVPYGCA